MNYHLGTETFVILQTMELFGFPDSRAYALQPSGNLRKKLSMRVMKKQESSEILQLLQVGQEFYCFSVGSGSTKRQLC